MRHTRNEKRETTHDWSNWKTKSRKNKNAQGKENLQILGHIGNWHHQTSADERKNLKRVS